MALLGGTGFPKIILEGIRVLTSLEAGYTPCVAGDIEKTVVGGTTGDTGTLLEYNNTTRIWKVQSDIPGTAGDFFDEAETLTITDGTGAGTTTGASTSESHTFTKYDCRKTDYFWPEEKDGPFKVATLAYTQFKYGHKLVATIYFTALAADNTVLDTFLKRIESCGGTIYLIPHIDYPTAENPHQYSVLKDGGWPYGYFRDKWIGFEGGIKLIGIELLTEPWAEET